MKEEKVKISVGGVEIFRSASSVDGIDPLPISIVLPPPPSSPPPLPRHMWHDHP